MGTTTGLLGTSYRYSPSTGSVRVDPNLAYDPYSRNHPSFNPTGEGAGFNEGGLTALQTDERFEPTVNASEAAQAAAQQAIASGVYGDVLAGYEGVRDPVTSAVSAAMANDAYNSQIENADAPDISTLDYYNKMKDTLESLGVDTTALREAAGLPPIDDLSGDLDALEKELAGDTGNVEQEGAATKPDTTGWVRTSPLGADTMTYVNEVTGETFNIDMTDYESLPPQDKAAVDEVNTRTDEAIKEATAETAGEAADDTKDTAIEDIVTLITNVLGGNTGGLVGGQLITGPFQTQAEADAAAAANAAATGDTFNDARDTNNTGDTLTVGDGNGDTGDKNGDGDKDGDGVVKTDDTTSTDSETGGGTSTVTGDGGTSVSDVFNGADGVDGIDGLNGLNGNDGTDGVDGKDGKNGRNGVSLGASPIAGGFLDTVFEVEDVLKPELLHLAKIIYS